MNAVSYMRCSGEGQIQGDTWDRQTIIIQKFALDKHIEIVREFRDEGITGKMELEGRAGLSACLQYVRENKIPIVLVEDSTRLARDMIVAEVIIREMQKIGVRVYAASGGIDLTEGDDSNPTAKLIRQILAAVSEFERCCIVLKLRGARQRKKEATGKCEGRMAFGTKPGEDEILKDIKFLRKEGLSYDSMAQVLNNKKVPTRTGKQWHGSTVGKILNRQSS